MTRKEYMLLHHPSRVNPNAAGGVEGCPDDYHLPPNEHICEDCDACWNKEIDNTDNKGEKEMPTNTTTKKTKNELLDEIKALKDEVARLERYKKYEEMADEMAAMRSSFVNAGFSANEAFTLVTTMIGMAATLNK